MGSNNLFDIYLIILDRGVDKNYMDLEKTDYERNGR